ncbi:phage antirepressor KilAC domain-containing protein [Bartonella sp. DGB1]|uniref:phage antirepressor KilAC domain-containing protein n=1 Tax=Bartonella sp. DGB1 TaxID=3239807 RepID=UPI003526806F
MDNQLMEIKQTQIANDTIQTVNARELHEFLQIGKDFSTWMTDRINQYNFKEGEDFVCSPILGSKGRGGHNRKEYHLTLDMAKELSMVERNDKGKEARQYFIRCEKKLKQPNTANITEVLNNPDNLKALLLDNVNKVIKLQEIVKEQEPKVKALEHLTRADGLLCITDTAKVLNMRPKDLFQYLQKHNWIYKRAGTSNFIPYQDKLKSGLMDCPTTTIHRPDGSEKIIAQAKITTKGLAILSEKLQATQVA